MPSQVSRSRSVALAGIGTAAGLFSGLFGVGGGTVLVPALVLWLGYGEREAAGTSLLAIVPIAAVAAVLQGALGNVDLGAALAVGLPAVAGVLAGTWLQQRVPQRAVSLAFAGVLVIAAAGLLI